MMKRLIGAAALVCALTGTAAAQNTSAQGSITASAANCVSANCVYYQLPPGTPWVMTTISGTWSGTVNIVLVSAANATYANLNTVPWNTVATVTANNTWSVSAAGATFVLVEASGWTSGKAQVTMTASQNGAPMMNPIFPGAVTSAGLLSDIILNATRHFDVRSVGAICNGIADDTAAFVSALARANQSLIELPQQTCKINPGPSSGASALIIPQAQQDFRIVGFQGQWGSVIASNTSNTSDAPLITVGDTRLTSTQWVEGADFQEFQLRGGNQDCYPNGVLHYTNNQNLSTSYNLGIRTWGTAYSTPCTFIGLMNDGPNWQEMKYYDLGIFGPSSSSWLTPSVSSTGMIISADQGNTDLFAPNIENFQTGINFRGAGGSPIVTISGGHFERVGLCWLDADQAQVFAYGVDVAAGMTCLGQGVFGSHIEMDAASVGWNAPVIDNGLGNSITQAAGSPGVAGATNTDGTEWYRVANAVPDPTFTAGTAGWTCTNANISVSEQKSPGAKVGQSIQVAPTSAGGYCTKSFVLPSSGDYLVGGSFFFDIYATAAQLQIYDQTCSVLLWDSGVFGASVATPGATYGTNAGDRAWRFIKTRVPSGSATSFCVRVIAPTASVPAIIAGLFIVPSAQTMTGASITGTGSCSGTGSAYACSTPGENGGAASNNISWTVSPQPYGSFLRLVCTAASDAGQPTIMYGYANGANVARLQPGATREITLPLGFFAGFVELYDYTGPTTDPNDISCTQLTVNPIYQELTIGIANPSDSNFVQYVDQAGVQHRGAPTVAGVPQVLCSITAPLTFFSPVLTGASPLNMSWLSFRLGRHGGVGFRTLFVQQTKHRRNKDQRSHRGTKQSTDYGAPEGRVLLASVTEPERHGNHADNHGERRHQDWTKARVTRFDRRLDRVSVVQQAFVGKGNNQNAVRGGHAHAHDGPH